MLQAFHPRAAGCAAARVMQQGCGVHDFQVGAFRQGQPFCDAVDPQDMLKIMHRVSLLVP